MQLTLSLPHLSKHHVFMYEWPHLNTHKIQNCLVAYNFKNSDGHGCLDGIQPEKVHVPLGHFAECTAFAIACRVCLAHCDSLLC